MGNDQIGIIGFDDTDESEYNIFTDKFKPKKTTDDCYTPPEVFAVIVDYCTKRYGIPPEKQLRPFYPGGDYEHFDYPEGSAVVDNPPFSILSAIVDFYNWKHIPFFLFAPYLTNFNIGKRCTHVIIDYSVTYENDAQVATSFVTNLEPGVLVRSDPELQTAIAKADKRRLNKQELPRYIYPENVLTAPMVGAMSKQGIDFVLNDDAACCIRALDSQKSAKKTFLVVAFS